MRLIAALSTLGCLALASLAGHQLWQVLAAPPPEQQRQELPTLAAGSAPPAPQRARRHWPALFGEKQPPRPAAAPVTPEPQPPQVPKPPLDSLGYVLKGRVQAGQATWAIVDHPSGEQLVRRGDSLREDVTVVRIDAEGLWVSRQGDAPELLGFAEN